MLVMVLVISASSCSHVNNELHQPAIHDTHEQLPVSQSAADTGSTHQLAVAQQKEVISIELSAEWSYRKGTSAVDKNWNKLNYNDNDWLKGKAGFGYGDGDDLTELDDMIGNYITVYVRKKFNYSGDFPVNTLLMNIYYDDGFIAYINGQEVARASMPMGKPTHLTRAKNSHEASRIASFDLTQHKHLLKTTENVLAIEVHNSSIRSSDLSLNPSLIFNKDASAIKKLKPVPVTKNKNRTKRKPKKNSFCNNRKSCGTLGNYQLKTAFAKLSFIPDDLSGITYVTSSDTFFLIDNGLGYILEVDSSYKLLRKIKTKGFGDSEDIIYLGSNNEFAIVNEDSKLFIGTISPETNMLDSNDFQEITFDTYQGNEGAEGVAFDITTQTFYIVKEEHPRKLYSFVRPAHKNNTTVKPTFPFDIQKIPYPRLTQDLSAITYNSATGRLLILSDIDYRVVDIALDGTVYGVLQLPERNQPEGITLDAHQNLHIVGEPNNYTIYTNPD